MLNILISCIGKQAFLVDSFKKALTGRGNVYASDFNSNASGLKNADRIFIPPAINESHYILWMLDICKKNEISLLFTLNVDDLLILEAHRQEFENINCKLIGGEIDSIINTYDKYLLCGFCKTHGFPYVDTYLLEDFDENLGIKLPLIAKPRYGKGSRGIRFLNTENELSNFLNEELDQSFIIQEVIHGKEYGFDIINDFDKKFAGIHVRRKLKMANGETNIAITEPSLNWLNFGRLLSESINHQGTIDVDAIIVGNKAFIIDINFRFGGGYIFSHAAGADTAKLYVAWALEEPINPSWLISKPGVTGKRNNSTGLVSLKD